MTSKEMALDVLRFVSDGKRISSNIEDVMLGVGNTEGARWENGRVFAYETIAQHVATLLRNERLGGA